VLELLEDDEDDEDEDEDEDEDDPEDVFNFLLLDSSVNCFTPKIVPSVEATDMEGLA